MNNILIALAFVGGLAGLVLLGMMVTMYFYTHDAFGLTRFDLLASEEERD
jgi:hypothetical protein